MVSDHAYAFPPGDHDFLFGTFLPARRASDKPIAMACFRLLTVAPEPPLFNVPRLRSCIALATFLDAPLLYFRAMGIPSHCCSTKL